MTILGQLRARRYANTTAAHRARYAAADDPADIRSQQLDRLNRSWSTMRAGSRLAQALRQRHGLPEKFVSWDAFTSLLPIQSKDDLQELIAVVGPDIGLPVKWMATGGTTSQPFSFPVSREEQSEATGVIWAARSRFGIGPADRLFMIWGHSHLLGRGLKGGIGRLRREAADRLLGYCRFSAYDLRPQAMQAAAEALIAHRARYVIGYSHALDRFARANEHRREAIHALKLAVVIATGEGFPDAESRNRIQSVFGCPVVMEYGAVETGPLAYEYTPERYSAFWHSCFFEGIPSAAVPGAQELVVTSLFARALPLFRYRIGDLVIPLTGESDLNIGFRAVLGRCNDLVEIPDGPIIHSEAISHVLRDSTTVLAYQFVLRRNGEAPTLRYEATHDLSWQEEEHMRERFRRIHSALAAAAFERVDALPKTAAGKRAMVIRE